jgi:NAD(P)-dependent dehydrogenase (short-subunit alcohol dehydrogenase family)
MERTMRLTDKVAIVTGAAGGIGRATSLKFAAEGAQVLAVDLNEVGLKETAAQSTKVAHHEAVVPFAADVTKGADVQRLVEEAERRYGHLNVVFSNAGIMRDGSVVDLSEEDWDAMFAVNVKGAFLLGKYAIPLMEDSGGSFIITASANSFFAESDIAGYCATKGAVMQLTRAMAIDHGPQGIRVNCICPGWIETPMSLPYLNENPGGREFAAKIAPAGRIGQPDDVAAVALFLASDESSFVTGAAYTVDGGWTAGMTKAVALI